MIGRVVHSQNSTEVTETSVISELSKKDSGKIYQKFLLFLSLSPHLEKTVTVLS